MLEVHPFITGNVWIVVDVDNKHTCTTLLTRTRRILGLLTHPPIDGDVMYGWMYLCESWTKTDESTQTNYESRGLMIGY